MHTVEVWRWVKSGLQVCELAVERGDGVFEHFPVCRGARAAEVVACACPRQFERTPALFADRRYLIDWSAPTRLPAGASPASPVVNVSWFAARAFCESEDARLPTWLEWEYAAAADESRRDARSDPAWRRRVLAWYERPASALLPAVGGPPNAYGVRDLHGLVWEWVDDFNALFIAGDSRTQGDPDLLKFCGSGAINIIDRDSYAVLMRIALLSSLNAADSTGTLGFRCARPVQGFHP